MNDQQQTLISRIGQWFRWERPREEAAALDNDNGGNGQTMIEPAESRSMFLRPWARRDAAISNLQDGFHTLTDLMSVIRDNLERQSARQDQLLDYLSHLPRVMQTLPEANRVQTETLRAIHQQMEHQNSQQKTIGDILERISRSGGDQREAIDELRDRVENLNEHDQAIADHLQQVGTAMQSVSTNSQTSSQILEQMRENINSHGGELERILHRQNTRFTTLLAIAILLSVAALAAVSIIGYLLLTR